MIEAVGVKKRFGERQILRGVDLTVKEGNTTCIIGGSGSGKSTFLKCVIGLVRPDEGDGRVPDPDLTKRVQAEALARKLIVLTAGTYVNVIRIIPPLVTTPEEVDLALAVLDESLAVAAA